MQPVKQLDLAPDARSVPTTPGDVEPAAATHRALLADVAADARREPERYLDETRVPEGGE
jgi:hypothetical protein